MKVDLIPAAAARSFCCRWHYSNIFPPHCMVYLGFYDAHGLAGVAIWGWGTRPMHTIKRLFPSLNTSDYWELCRLCCRDEMPRNTESQFISHCVAWFKRYQPSKVLLFSWADGIRGKAGYVYQASGWLYGGFITTEIYLTQSGEPVHPRLMITRYGTRDKATWTGMGLRRVCGKQFRYVKFLCGHARRKRLIAESPIAWGTAYPKDKDLLWSIDAGQGSRETRDVPNVERAGQFRRSALSSQYLLFGD